MDTTTVEMMRKSLEWARESQHNWRSAFESARDAGHFEDANVAASQIAMFDRIIERYGRWLEEHTTP